MPRSSRRRGAGANEQRQREMRERAFDEGSQPDAVWSPPRPGEWWALAPGSVIHMIAKVNDKLRVTYVVPMCGGRPSQARIQVPYGDLREDAELQRQLCSDCWNDPRAESISILRYGPTTEFSAEDLTHALGRLETFV